MSTAEEDAQRVDAVVEALQGPMKLWSLVSVCEDKPWVSVYPSRARLLQVFREEIRIHFEGMHNDSAEVEKHLDNTVAEFDAETVFTEGDIGWFLLEVSLER